MKKLGISILILFGAARVCAQMINVQRDVSICPGASTTLHASGGDSYSWSPASGLNNPSSPEPIASPTVTTTYTVVVCNNITGCAVADSVVVNVNSLPVVNAGNDTAVCSGMGVMLNASGAVNYTWSPGLSLSDSTIANPVASPQGTTTYTVTGTGQNGCSDTSAIIVTVVPLPSVHVLAPSLSICPGGNANLSASGATSYSWSPSSSLVMANTATPIASPPQTTVYTVTGTQNTTVGSTVVACSAQDTARVIVFPVPPANAGANTGICYGGSTTLNGSGGGTYSWSPAAGLSSTTIANPVANPDTTTTYTLTVMGTGFCTATSQVTITVNPNPVAAAGPDVSICHGSSVLLSASGGDTYSWSPASGLSNSTSASPTASPGSTTQYIVTVSTTAGCMDKDTVVVNVNNAILLGPVSVVAETCTDANGAITVGGVTGGTAPYTYSLNGGPSQSSPVFSSLGQGTYIIRVTDAAGCSETQTVTVGRITNVDASFTADPGSGSYPLTVNFTNTSTGATSYTWDFGNSASSLLSNPSTVYSGSGVYEVTLYASNGPVCADSAKFTINVYEEMVFVIPNIFTPNGDNNNDVFRVRSTGLTELSGTIFNRWGKKLYEWKGDANSGWDGKVNGNVVEDGTYYYVLRLKSADGTEKELKGYVQVFSD